MPGDAHSCIHDEKLFAFTPQVLLSSTPQQFTIISASALLLKRALKI
jgi:hypothetical protein